MGHFWIGFFSGFRLQNQFCYTHRQYLYSFGNVRVFSIQSCQLYAYSSIFCWQNIPFKTGTFIFQKWKYCPLTPRCFNGIDLTTSSGMAEHQIQIKLLEIFNFHTITSAIHKIKALLLVNPATMSDFKKALLRKQTMLLSEDSTPSNKHRQKYFIPPGLTHNLEITI